MKRLFFLFLLLPCLLSPVFATENNEFFNRHAEECVYDGRDYLLNHPSGYVTVLDAPNGQVQDYLLNEQTLTIFASYTDSTGSLWAQLRYSVISRGIAISDVEGDYIGWALLSSFYRPMNKSDFLTLHQHELVNRPLRLHLSRYPNATLWPYPGAIKPCGYLRWYVDDPYAEISFPTWWQDPAGYRWGIWDDYFVCLDLPSHMEAVYSADNTIFYPALPLDTLPLPNRKTSEEDSPSSLPYYLLAVALLLGASALYIRKTDKKERM